MKKNKLLIIRKGIKVMTYAILIFLGLLIFVIVNLAIISPGKPEALEQLTSDAIDVTNYLRGE